MVLMKKKERIKTKKYSLVGYYAPVAKWEDEKKFFGRVLIAGSNCRVQPEG